MTRKLVLWLPFGLGFGLFLAFWVGLRQPDDNSIVSQVVGKPLPEFTTSAVLPGQDGFAATYFRDGKPRLLNVFGSWCVPCVREIPMLLRLQAAGAESPSIRAAAKRPCPAITSPEPSTSTGLVNPNAAMLAEICRSCFLE